jgi:L,D-transpeptidase catalytic domain
LRRPGPSQAGRVSRALQPAPDRVPVILSTPPWRAVPALGLCVAGASLSLILGCGESPRDQLEAARRAMRRGGEAGGLTRAPEICAAAQAALLHAEAEIRMQEKRSVLSRDQEEAKRLVARAHLAAESCAFRAIAARDRARVRAAQDLDDLEAWIHRIELLARHAPGGEKAEEEIVRATVTLGEGRDSFSREQYERAADAAQRGQALVSDAVSELGRYFDGFLLNPRMPVWKRWISETLRDSRRENATVILVDKLRRQLLLIRGKEELASYDVDLGTGGMAVKTRAGDRATPEGRYRVTEVRNPGQTKFYRALMLDYPNDEDRERFRDLRRSGVVSRRQGIGSLIEIHGHGGRGEDWTEGCVALDNDDMDDLVRNVKVGTRVTIVGTIPEGTIP